MNLWDYTKFRTRFEGGSDCWQWIAAKTAGGYGQMKLEGSNVPQYAHRLSYEHFVGPIPAGLQIDHKCRNRACVNPDHLELVTSGENTRRGRAAQPKTHCRRGHELTAGNVYVSKRGKRQCRRCALGRARAHAERCSG